MQLRDVDAFSNKTMKNIFSAAAILGLLLSGCVTSYAWSSPGHMVIAAIAYRDLSVTERANVDELLRHHPDYQKWTNSIRGGAPDLGLGAYIFMRASVWPDEIRRKGNPYDHPEWHYIDYPLTPPNFPELPAPSPGNDILYGIRQSEMMLTNQTSTSEEKAVYLSWIIHLVGDIHQPLHCATLVNADYPAPFGDKGGNNFYVRPTEAPVSLHAIWDKALGSGINARSQFNYAIAISKVYPRINLPELTKYKTPDGWSIESRDIAVASGYLSGTLKGSKEKAGAPSLPPDYLQNAKRISEKQAALAGYRLEDEITKLLR
ncbi:MAG: S1/P1 nuclease [Patescibacteria group bacterium]|nr:S1/P1 nuclease [Patescibacteria group bacterium]